MPGLYTRPVGTVVWSEGELLARLRAGDELAFRALVKRHDAAMRRLALSFVQTVSVADEVVQEPGWPSSAVCRPSRSAPR